MSPDVLVTLIFSVFIEISLIEGGLDQLVLIGGCSPLAEVIGPLYHQLDIILLHLIITVKKQETNNKQAISKQQGKHSARKPPKLIILLICKTSSQAS